MGMDNDDRLIFRVIGWSVIAFVALVIVGGALNCLGGALRPVTPEVALYNYHWFYDAKNRVDARVAQITAEKATVAETTDPAELGRLRVDLGGMQQSCRELVADYDSHASEVDKGLFKSNSLPDRLDPEVCE